MKICITTIGSTGDVQPILALATGLREAGHDVLFAAADRYEERVRSFGVPFKTIGRAWDDAEMEERFRSVGGGAGVDLPDQGARGAGGAQAGSDQPDEEAMVQADDLGFEAA